MEARTMEPACRTNANRGHYDRLFRALTLGTILFLAGLVAGSLADASAEPELPSSEEELPPTLNEPEDTFSEERSDEQFLSLLSPASAHQGPPSHPLAPSSPSCSVADIRAEWIDVNDGCLKWKQHYDGQPGSGLDHAKDIAVSPNGERIYITARSVAADWSSERGVTIAYDAETGQTLWVKSSGGEADPSTLELEVDASDRVHAIGGSSSSIKVSVFDGQTGNLISAWETEPEVYDGEISEVIVRPSGIFAIYEVGYKEDQDFVALRMDVETGEALWERVFDGAGGMEDRVADLAIDPSGDQVYVTGSMTTDRQPVPDKDPLVVARTFALDTNSGETVAVYQHETEGMYVPSGTHSPVSEVSRAVSVSPNGDALVIGLTAFEDTGGWNIVVDVVDTTSDERRWQASYSDGENLRDLAISEDTVYATGIGFGQTSLDFDFATVALDLVSGEKAWTSVWDGKRECNDYPRSLELGPQGEDLFVVGVTPNPKGASPVWSQAMTRTECYTGIQRTSTIGTMGVRNGVWRYATVAFDTGSGEVDWSAVYEAGDWGGHPEMVVNEKVGTVNVAGVENTESTSDALLLSYPTQLNSYLAQLDDINWPAFEG